jgi:predicted NUDIX family NTP pyrophosphohydrolase
MPTQRPRSGYGADVPVLSAGLLVHRQGPNGALEVLIVHPGGPFWAHKDLGAWSIPKGEYAPDEPAHAAARREFAEELGVPPPAGAERFLGERRQPSGKVVSVWAVDGDVDLSSTHSNEVTMEWPRGSGRTITFPEVDRAEWCTIELARQRLLRGQVVFLDELVAQLGHPG